MITKFLLYLLLIILAICQKAFCQQTQGNLIRESVKEETNSMWSKFIDIRRDVHHNPELAYENIFPVNGNS